MARRWQVCGGGRVRLIDKQVGGGAPRAVLMGVAHVAKPGPCARAAAASGGDVSGAGAAVSEAANGVPPRASAKRER